MKISLQKTTGALIGFFILSVVTLNFSNASHANLQIQKSPEIANGLLPVRLTTKATQILDINLGSQEILVVGLWCETPLNCQYGNSYSILNGVPVYGRWWIEKRSLCRDCDPVLQLSILVSVSDTLLSDSKEDSNVRFEKILLTGQIDNGASQFPKTLQARYWLRTPSQGYDPDVSFEDRHFPLELEK